MDRGFADPCLASAGRCQLLPTITARVKHNCSLSFTPSAITQDGETSQRYLHCVYVLTISQLDRLVGLSMLIAATSIFVYYTVWTLFMVRPDQ